MPSIQRVNAACCVPESNCVNGAPQACNGQCAHVFLPFYNRCYSALAASSPKAMDTFDLLAARRDSPAAPLPCLPPRSPPPLPLPPLQDVVIGK